MLQQYALQAIKTMKNNLTINKSTSAMTGSELNKGVSPSHTIVVPMEKGVTRLPMDHAKTTMEKTYSNGMENRKNVFACFAICEKQKARSALTYYMWFFYTSEIL